MQAILLSRVLCTAMIFNIRRIKVTLLASPHIRLNVSLCFSLIQHSRCLSPSLFPLERASRWRSVLVLWFRRSLSRPGARVLLFLSRWFSAGRQLSGGGDCVEPGLLGAPDNSVPATKSYQVRASNTCSAELIMFVAPTFWQILLCLVLSQILYVEF